MYGIKYTTDNGEFFSLDGRDSYTAFAKAEDAQAYIDSLPENLRGLYRVVELPKNVTV